MYGRRRRKLAKCPLIHDVLLYLGARTRAEGPGADGTEHGIHSDDRERLGMNTAHAHGNQEPRTKDVTGRKSDHLHLHRSRA